MKAGKSGQRNLGNEDGGESWQRTQVEGYQRMVLDTRRIGTKTGAHKERNNLFIHMSTDKFAHFNKLNILHALVTARSAPST